VLTQSDRSLEVIPAVDVLAGRAVRLAQGEPERVTAEGGDPVELAKRWADEGAERVHLVDLDGAFTGAASSTLVSRVASVGLPLQVGGGLRSIGALSAALEAGADRVMVGTAALDDAFLSEAVERFGKAVVVAIDVRGGRVAVEGWRRTTDEIPSALAQRCADAGVRRLLVTSTRRDGSLAGPDLGLLEEVIEVGLPVLAAGGIGTVDDLQALKQLGCEGAVVGTALLRNAFSLRDALASVAAT
jgi:phosphoribosylformimino-5-aminoimidazole carboxamide ribotide isomerase